MKKNYTYEEAIKITSDFLNTIDLLPILHENGDKSLSEIMTILEDSYLGLLRKDEFFKGYLFNMMDEDDFISYLKTRYGTKFRPFEITRHYFTIAW